MDVLVIGGTRFVGRHIVERALAGDHSVTLFNRGQSAPGLFDDVREIHGDRDGETDALGDSRFDVVIDTSGYLPRVVRQSVEHLKQLTDRYLFISSISVYPETANPPITENAAVLELDEPGSEDISKHYGSLKVGCERVVQEVFADRATVVRPGLIVGPHDPTNRFTYWVTRIARGGTVLAPEPRDQPSQVIDARDLAAFVLSLAESGKAGVYNATTPQGSRTLEETLDSVCKATDSDARLEWVDASFLLDRGVEPWTRLPLWVPDKDDSALMQVDVTAALENGLVSRPLEETVADTLAWTRELDELPGDGGLDPAHESRLLREWAARTSGQLDMR